MGGVWGEGSMDYRKVQWSKTYVLGTMIPPKKRKRSTSIVSRSEKRRKVQGTLGSSFNSTKTATTISTASPHHQPAATATPTTPVAIARSAAKTTTPTPARVARSAVATTAPTPVAIARSAVSQRVPTPSATPESTAARITPASST